MDASGTEAAGFAHPSRAARFDTVPGSRSSRRQIERIPSPPSKAARAAAQVFTESDMAAPSAVTRHGISPQRFGFRGIVPERDPLQSLDTPNEIGQRV